MIYENGTVTSAPDYPFQTGTGTAQSLIAQGVAPPRKKKVHWILWAVLFLSLPFFYRFPILVIVPATVICLVAVWNLWINRTHWPTLQQKWERSWLCVRCGQAFDAN